MLAGGRDPSVPRLRFKWVMARATPDAATMVVSMADRSKAIVSRKDTAGGKGGGRPAANLSAAISLLLAPDAFVSAEHCVFCACRQ